MTSHPPTTLDSLLALLPNGAGSKLADDCRRAYEFALHAHADQSRPSGELFIEHDLAIAKTLAELGLDGVSIVAGLLHDILLPHTKITLEKVLWSLQDMKHRITVPADVAAKARRAIERMVAIPAS